MSLACKSYLVVPVFYTGFCAFHIHSLWHSTHAIPKASTNVWALSAMTPGEQVGEDDEA